MDLQPEKPSVSPEKRGPPIHLRTFWASVAGGIIASILFSLFFQPILTWISNVTVSTIGVFYAGYVDKLYYDAAESPTDSLIYMTYALTAGVPVVLCITLILSLLVRQALRQISDEARRRIGLYTVCITLPFLLISITIIVAGPAVSIRANSAFQRRLMALAPVITEEERKNLLGKWAMVKSESDYQHIKTDLEDLAEKYHTTLPYAKKY